MKSKAVFYHAGCPVCVSAEEHIAKALDPAKFECEVVHLGKQAARIGEAERRGVKSVPALVTESGVYHINFGASLADLKK